MVYCLILLSSDRNSLQTPLHRTNTWSGHYLKFCPSNDSLDFFKVVFWLVGEESSILSLPCVVSWYTSKFISDISPWLDIPVWDLGVQVVRVATWWPTPVRFLAVPPILTFTWQDFPLRKLAIHQVQWIIILNCDYIWLFILVTYRLGLFPLKDQESCLPMDLVRGHFTSDPVVDTVDDHALVTGHSVHVIVDPDTGKSMTIPPDMREKLSQLKPLQWRISQFVTSNC